MADVVISYARENEATARQLAEAVGRLGYDVWRPEGGADAANSDMVTERIVGAEAVIVIWSSAAAASEWIRAEANIARGLKKLVQASADGNPPPIPFDPAQVSSISTWLGDDGHPGWDAIKAELAGLAGTPVVAQAPIPEPEPGPEVRPEPPRAPPAPAPVWEALSDPEPAPLSDPEPSLPSAPTAAMAAAPPSAPPPRRGPNILLIVILLLVLAGLAAAGYWFWQRSQLPVAASAETNTIALPEPTGPDTPQDVPLVPGDEVPAPPPADEVFDRQARLQTAGPAIIRSAPSAAGFTVGQIAPGEIFQTYQQSGEWWRVRTAAGVTGYVLASAIRTGDADAPQTAQPAQTTPQSRPERRAEPRQPRGPRIRKENSEVMEAFCANAGRGTPQCRRFQRSTY